VFYREISARKAAKEKDLEEMEQAKDSSALVFPLSLWEDPAAQARWVSVIDSLSFEEEEV